MNFFEWRPVYDEILADFGFDPTADERSRDVLAELARPFDESRLATLFGDSSVAVVGAASTLGEDVSRGVDADVVVAASTAADVLRDAGIGVDLMVTDLDKNPETARELTYEGIPVAAHAHGDNIPAVREQVPTFDPDHTLATTQAAPVDSVANYGGFTDGDRAAFLADAFDAAELHFVGWDFDDPSVDPMKAQKLRWAEQLLYWLETRREERFDVLDGRRAGLQLPEGAK